MNVLINNIIKAQKIGKTTIGLDRKKNYGLSSLCIMCIHLITSLCMIYTMKAHIGVKKTHEKKTMNNDLIECHKLHFNSLYAFS